MNDEEKRRWLRRYRDAVRAEKMLQEELEAKRKETEAMLEKFKEA